jgi:hypothetical protein
VSTCDPTAPTMTPGPTRGVTPLPTLTRIPTNTPIPTVAQCLQPGNSCDPNNNQCCPGTICDFMGSGYECQ